MLLVFHRSSRAIANVAHLAWTRSWDIPPMSAVPVVANPVLFCRAIDPKRRSNCRVCLGILLIRHFVGLK
jgi:hypothetical protein